MKWDLIPFKSFGLLAKFRFLGGRDKWRRFKKISENVKPERKANNEGGPNRNQSNLVRQRLGKSQPQLVSSVPYDGSLLIQRCQTEV